MMYEIFPDHLEHHGVKGQKWGVRRYQNKDGSLTRLGRKRLGLSSGTKAKLKAGARKAADKTKAAAKSVYEKQKAKASKKKSAKRVNPSLLSDDELNKKIERLKLEKKYNDLYSEVHPKHQRKAIRAVGTAIKTIGKSTFDGIGEGVKPIAKAGTTYFGKKILRDQLGDDRFYKIFPDDKPKEDKGSDSEKSSSGSNAGSFWTSYTSNYRGPSAPMLPAPASQSGSGKKKKKKKR